MVLYCVCDRLIVYILRDSGGILVFHVYVSFRDFFFFFLWLTSTLVTLVVWRFRIKFCNNFGIGKLSKVFDRSKCTILSNALLMSRKTRVASHFFDFADIKIDLRREMLTVVPGEEVHPL